MDFLALLFVIACGRFRRHDLVLYLQESYAAKIEDMADSALKSPQASWPVMVAAPAAIVMVIDYSVSGSMLLSFLFSAAVVFVSFDAACHLYFSKRVLYSVYGNDDHQTRYLLKRWPSSGYLGDDDNVFPVALATCARNLHTELLAVIFWLALAGPGGAALYAGHRLYKLKRVPPSPIDWLVEAPPALVSVCYFAVAGSFSSSLRAAADSVADPVPAAAYASSGIDPAKIDIETIPGYERLLWRVGGASMIFALVVTVAFA